MANISWLGYAAFAFGLGLAVIGLRAAIARARPVDVGVPQLPAWFRSSRGIGLFYVVAGVVWMASSIGIIGI